MARIRSIKPEFPQSESMGRITRDARLTFIQCWTLSDDEGRLRGNSRMLASLLFPYDDDAPALIDGWLSELEREACIVRYQAEGQSYIQIHNWLNHQKIDHASKSKIPAFDESSRIVAKPREASSEDQGRDQGVDQGSRIGLEADQGSNPLQPAAPTAKKKNDLTADETALQAVCRETWQRYSEAYAVRYGATPIRNAKINGQVKQFCQRVPEAEAPAIAAFYVRHNASFYVGKGHAVGPLLADAEKLRTEWATNQTITATQAQQADKTQANGNTWNKVLAGIEERDRNAAIN